MYVTMQKQFEEQFERPDIEDKKKRLKIIRLDRITPINHSNIKKHNKEYQQNIK